jgi:transcriptional regulator with XRE-family HTH domain
MGNLKSALMNYKRNHPDVEWRDMADAIGISMQSLLNYLGEKSAPRDSTLTMISKVLEIPKDELKDEEMEPEEAEDAEEEPEAPEEPETEVHITVGEPPTIGVKPYYVATAQRIKELADAISRNPVNYQKIPEWAEEIIEQAELAKRMERRNHDRT